MGLEKDRHSSWTSRDRQARGKVENEYLASTKMESDGWESFFRDFETEIQDSLQLED